MTLSVIESGFKLNAGWFVTLTVIFVADMQANGCASLVSYQHMYEDASSKDLDGCIVSTVWDCKTFIKDFFYNLHC